MGRAVVVTVEERRDLWAAIATELKTINLSPLTAGLTAEELQGRRRRVELHVAMLDDLGWARADPREEFTLRVLPGLEEWLEYYGRAAWECRDRDQETIEALTADRPYVDDRAGAAQTSTEVLEQARQCVEADEWAIVVHETVRARCGDEGRVAPR